MENPNIGTPAREEELELKAPEFKKSDFTIRVDSIGDGFEKIKYFAIMSLISKKNLENKKR